MAFVQAYECPLCGQPLSDRTLVAVYNDFFSAVYKELGASVRKARDTLSRLSPLPVGVLYPAGSSPPSLRGLRAFVLPVRNRSPHPHSGITSGDRKSTRLNSSH